MVTLMNLGEAKAFLKNIPTAVQNNNAVQSGAYRLREAIKRFEKAGKRFDRDQVPGYVHEAVNDLQSWINHAANREK